MHKLIKSLVVVAISAILLSSCAHKISVEQAANGNAGKCGKKHS